MAGPTMILGASKSFAEIINYELIRGNVIWRFGVVLVIALAALVAGRIVQFMFNGYARRIAEKKGEKPLGLVFKAIANPTYVAIFAAGLYLCKLPLVFHDETGIRIAVETMWKTIARVVDDMLVPVVRKALRVTIAIVAILLISETILGANVKSLLLSAGVGGIAVALAAKDTIANFFGSITIFADRPFQMGEMVKIGDCTGPVEEVGFRSTRIRTLKGHLVTVPNSVIANSMVENIGKRPFIRRVSNITITYDSGHSKAEKAVEIIKDGCAGGQQRC